MKKTRSFGTSSLVVAAFIGPGTVLTCAAAGVHHGYDLAWVLIVATAGVYVLQTFTAGTGILAGQGLGDAIREMTASGKWHIPVAGLVILGLWVGSAAFESGNVLGAAEGFRLMTGADVSVSWLAPGVGGAAALILLLDLRRIRQILTAIVAVMGGVFVVLAASAHIEWGRLLGGLFRPGIPEGGLVTALALVGTTIVTYNLFLHAGISRRFWEGEDPKAAFQRERLGMRIFLPLGGFVSLAILMAGASLHDGTTHVSDAGGFAALLNPVAGRFSSILFGTGLFAAGLTSAVTAPLAVAAGISELFGFEGSSNNFRFRALWASVVVTGILVGSVGWSPLKVIIAAQAANGLLLPIIAAIVVLVVRRTAAFVLPRLYRILGWVVLLFCAGLGIKTLYWVWTTLN